MKRCTLSRFFAFLINAAVLYNELLQVEFCTGNNRKGKQNLYLLALRFLYKLVRIYFICNDTERIQTISNIAVYGSATQLVIWPANLTKF